VTERLDAVDWAALFHAEGSAADTPRRLRALLGSDEEDPSALVDGYSLLWRTLHPERKAWPAAAPSALLVAGLLDDPRLGADDPSLPRALLAYLQSFAMAADFGGEEPALRARVQRRAPELPAWTKDYLAADPDRRARMWTEETGVADLVLEQARLACFDLVPEILDRVLPHLATRDARHRAAAAGAVGALAKHPSAQARKPALVERLTSLAADTESTYDLATVVIAVGLLDGDTRPWLADPHLGVRGCAALAPGLMDDDTATEVLVQLSRAPRAFSASFGESAPPHHFLIPPQPDLLTEALVERVSDPQILAPALVAHLQIGERTAYQTLTPLLRAIFPDPSACLSAIPRRLAELVAHQEGLWELSDAARAKVFVPAGLSADRVAWVAMAKPAAPSQRPAVYSPDDIAVFEGFTVIRSRPETFFGVGRANPGLVDRIVGVLRAQFDHAVSTGHVESFRLEVHPTTQGRRFTVDVRGHQLPSASTGFDAVFARLHSAWPLEYLSIAAALSSRIWVKEWSAGRCTAAEYVDGLALGPAQTVPAAPSRDGYEVTLEFDDAWRPLGHVARVGREPVASPSPRR
jgi:hypothetical protein